jgi:Mrp family chromosome partitioning ATPase
VHTGKAKQATAEEFDFLSYSLQTPLAPLTNEFVRPPQYPHLPGAAPQATGSFAADSADLLTAESLAPTDLTHQDDAEFAAGELDLPNGMHVREVTVDSGRLDPHLVMLNEADPAAAEQYHRLAAALIAAAVERPLKRVLIVSALHGDGRTCVTLNLAGALARARRRVLVVDADLLRPSVLRLLGVESDAPVAEAFAAGADAAKVRAALVQLQPYEFTVLPSRGQVENAAELLASAEFGQLLDELDADYDFVLFDSAPLLVAGDAHLLLHYADTALLVVTPEKCRGGQVAQAIAPIPPEDLFGVVLNRTTGRSA